jgi:hypothetical protein
MSNPLVSGVENRFAEEAPCDGLCRVGIRSFFSEQAHAKTGDGHDRKNEKQNFCYLDRASGDASEPEDRSNQRNDQKDNGVMKHNFSGFLEGIGSAARLAGPKRPTKGQLEANFNFCKVP